MLLGPLRSLIVLVADAALQLEEPRDGRIKRPLLSRGEAGAVLCHRVHHQGQRYSDRKRSTEGFRARTGARKGENPAHGTVKADKVFPFFALREKRESIVVIWAPSGCTMPP